MVRAGLNVHGCRSWHGIANHWHLVNGQHMRPGWQPSAIAVTLYDVRHRPAINLKIESEIPSEVRCSIHGELARWEVVIRPEVAGRGTSLRNSADPDCARKSKNQKNDAGEAVSWFHSIYYTCELRLRQQIRAESVSNCPEVRKLPLRYHSACGDWKNRNLPGTRGKIAVLNAVTPGGILRTVKIGNSSVKIHRRKADQYQQRALLTSGSCGSAHESRTQKLDFMT